MLLWLHLSMLNNHHPDQRKLEKEKREKRIPLLISPLMSTSDHRKDDHHEVREGESKSPRRRTSRRSLPSPRHHDPCLSSSSPDPLAGSSPSSSSSSTPAWIEEWVIGRRIGACVRLLLFLLMGSGFRSPPQSPSDSRTPAETTRRKKRTCMLMMKSPHDRSLGPRRHSDRRVCGHKWIRRRMHWSPGPSLLSLPAHGRTMMMMKTHFSCFPMRRMMRGKKMMMMSGLRVHLLLRPLLRSARRLHRLSPRVRVDPPAFRTTRSR